MKKVMAKQELQDFLKGLKPVLTSASEGRICNAYSQLSHFIQDETSGFSDQFLKGVFKCMTLSLGQYSTNKSRNASCSLVRDAVTKYPGSAAKHFIDGTKEFCDRQVESPTGGDVFDWLNWSEIILEIAIKDATLLTSLMKSQAQVTYSVKISDKKTIILTVRRLWTRILKKHPDLFPKYISVLSEGDAYKNLPLLSSLIEVATTLKFAKVAETCSKLIELATKTLFALKTVPSLHYLDNLAPILSQCTHDVFSNTLLSTMKRFMLRNPELALFISSPMIHHVTLDLSKYAVELSKLLATEAKCKQEDRRKTAVLTYRYLAEHCSDPEALTQLIKHMFGVLKGSDGKITVMTERMDVVSAIGNLIHNTVSGSLAVQGIATEAMSQFTAVLNAETNETMIVHLVTELTKWVKLSSSKIPADLLERIKMGSGQKTASSVVRQAYLLLMTTCLNNADSMASLQVFESALMSAVQTAQSQPAQIPTVCEGVYSAVLLLRLLRAVMLSDENRDSLWKVLLSSDKQLFTNDRLLQSAPVSVLSALATLSEMLVLQHPEKMTEKLNEQYISTLLYVCCHNDYSSRKTGQQCVKKIVSGLGGLSLALNMIDTLGKLLNQQNWSEILNDNIEGERVVHLTAKGFTETLHTVTSVPTKDSKELSQIALSALVPSHHEAIDVYEKDSWIRLISNFKLSPEKLIAQSVDSKDGELLKNLTSGEDLMSAKIAALKTLVRVNGLAVVPCLLEQCRKLLSSEELTKISSEEYNIFLWPDGELYDTSVIDKNKEVEDNRNMRRENKLYSYEDQLMEMELRKELEAKRKAQGKQVKEKLTPKQIEARKAQLKIESEIRKEVAQLDAAAVQSARILKCIVDADAVNTSHFMPSICELLSPLIVFPVTATHLSTVFVSTLQAALQNQAFGELVGYLTLRVYTSACELPTRWSTEDLTKQRNRVLDQLAAESPMNAAAFSCCYPLFKRILNTEGISDAQRLSILKVFEAHTDLRSDLETDGPAILPRCDMMKVLLKLSDTGSRKVNAAASTVIVKVCESASGDDGCTVAEQDELDVLLDALTWPNNHIRLLSLKCVSELVDVLPSPDTDYEAGMALMKRLWIARFDPNEPVAALATQLWDDLSLELDTAVCTDVLTDIVSTVQSLRSAVASSLRQLLEDDSEHLSTVLELAMSLYQEKLYRAPPVLDNYGRVVQAEAADQWQAREGVAMLFSNLAPILTKADVETLINFYVPNALHDRDEKVALTMRSAAVQLIEHHGKDNVQTLLPILEQTLTNLPDTGGYDIVKQGVVVLMGNLAKHLDRDDPRVKPIVAKLVSSLSTPSQQVQEAVAQCLPALVPSIRDDVSELIGKLLMLLLNSDNYGERKGAAYGLAGLVKGSGILSLKQLDIMTTLTTAVQNKKSAKEREGALFAFELLSGMLGRLFEPYIVQVLPNLLLCFGDSNHHVRAAAEDTAKVVMSKLSAHGVKLVLPVLLKALEEDQWRTKCGSVELLGAMAFCAPKQLSACLPQIVPKLIDVLADSHDRVSKSGATALQHIGEVIKNPEIQSIVPIMLNALRNPAFHTTECLQTLLDTQFVHFIDAPSLALIMPVVTRAIEDRSTETRKMACQIIGNMYSLTDQKDLSPYLANIMPGLKKSLVDPVPEVRGMSARALGAMVRGIGEQGFDNLLPWLMATLTSDGNTVNRSGAAQGLSEVIGALGIDKLRKYIDEIVETANRPDIPPFVRDGYIMMFIYLPVVFKDDFTQFIGPILPTILKALADESEYVRDTGLKAGQKIINMYANSSIELLLPELENGLFDENWRIRLSSVQLLGDLLYSLSGVSGKMSTASANDDDNFGTEISQQMVIEALGNERRNRVLSGLYMGRSDIALLVRQASLHVWKVIVSNTPKTLRDILPTLFSLLLGCLASTSFDKREVAARTLGDVVKKLGERVLPEILPILSVGLESDDADKRQGVCIGLSEIMNSTGRDHIIGYSDSLVPTVSRALSDTAAPVREAAAKTFDSLHANIGTRALEEILPELLRKLNDESMKEYALDGLQQVMAIKSHAVLPYLVPKLIAPPVNTKALSLLASVAGVALDRELHKILQAMGASLASKLGTPDESEELGFCSAVVLSVQTDQSVRTVIDESIRMFSNKETKIQAASAMILNVFCKETKMEYDDHLSQLFRTTIGLLALEEEIVIKAAWECVNSIVKRLDANKAMMQVPTVKQALRYAVADTKGTGILPGLCILKKGITCLLPVFREGLLSGAPEMKETSALGLSDAIKAATSDALKQSVVHITGPLIRVLGDRYGPTVRVAMLETINILLVKCGPMLKPFLPQLQTTFVKALNDASRPVRLKAAEAMSQLIIIHMRVDPVFTELVNGVKSYPDDSSVRETFLFALRLCVAEGGKKMGAPVRQDITKTITGLMSHDEDNVRTAAAACLGALITCLSDEEKTDVILTHILDTNGSDWMVMHSRCVALFVALKQSTECLLDGDSNRESIITTLITHATSDKVPISQYGLRGIAMLLKYDVESAKTLDKRLVIAVKNGMKSDSNDVKQLIGNVVELVSRVANQSSAEGIDESTGKVWIPTLIVGTKEKNSAVKAFSEYALITLLQLRRSDEVYKKYLPIIDGPKGEALADTYTKNLKRVLKLAEPKEDVFDKTILI